MFMPLIGKYNTAKVFTHNVDSETQAQIIQMLNQPFTADSQVRIMSDCHAGKGCVVGTTMTLTDKVVPNLVGVDIGCLDKDSEILTENGWIKISEYNQQKILVYDNIQKISRFEQPLFYIKLPCDEFYHFHHSKGLDQMFSEEHRMVILKGYRNKGYSTEIIQTHDFVNSIVSNKKLDYYGTSTVFDISNRGLGLSDKMIKILVMVSADGRVRYNKSKTKTYVELHFKKQRKINRADELLSEANIKHSCNKMKDGTTYMSFTLDMFYDKSLKMFYKASTKELKVLCDEIYHWDGSIDHKRNHYNFSTSDKENADVVQFALASQGIRAGIDVRTHDQKENRNDIYNVYQTKNPIVTYNSNKNIKKVKSADGFKYCFTTSTGFFVMRRNNNICITGNCGMYALKLEEADIDLKLLDEVINTDVPSGFSIHDRAVTKFDKLKDILCNIDIDNANRSIGSLGGGNHFIEIDRDKDGALWLVIHCGSRHLGIEVCNHYQKAGIRHMREVSIEPKIKETIADLKARGLEKDIENTIKILKMQHSPVPDDLAYIESEDFSNYLHDMEITQEFSALNRQTIADIIVHKMGLHPIDSFDTIHNYIDVKNMILRKGSISAQLGERVIIPMNMRDGSLICIGKGNPDWNYSAPHGAGRIMSRGQAKENVDFDEFKKSMEGIYSTSVVQSTVDESPFVYKPIEEIMENIVDTVDIVDIIKPIYNFKAH